jgi:hypothetical protein
MPLNGRGGLSIAIGTGRTVDGDIPQKTKFCISMVDCLLLWHGGAWNTKCRHCRRTNEAKKRIPQHFLFMMVSFTAMPMPL